MQRYMGFSPFYVDLVFFPRRAFLFSLRQTMKALFMSFLHQSEVLSPPPPSSRLLFCDAISLPLLAANKFPQPMCFFPFSCLFQPPLAFSPMQALIRTLALVLSSNNSLLLSR